MSLLNNGGAIGSKLSYSNDGVWGVQKGGMLGHALDFETTDRYGEVTVEVVGTVSAGENITSASVPAGTQEGDVVFVFGSADAGASHTPTGYTLLNFNSGTVDGITAYKVMGATPDTTVAGLDVSYVYLIATIRGLDTAALGQNQTLGAAYIIGMPEIPAMSGITVGDVIIGTGYLDDDAVASSVTAPTGWTLIGANDDAGNISCVMAAFKIADATTEAAAFFGGTGSDAVGSFAHTAQKALSDGNVKNSGIWNANRALSGIDIIQPVTYSSSDGFDAELMTIPAMIEGQMVVFVERGNTSTPPALKAGFSNILTDANESKNRSMRISYRIGSSASESFTVEDHASYTILDNASSIGKSVSWTNNDDGTLSNVITYPALTGLNQDGNSLVLALSYAPVGLTSIDSPYTVMLNVGGYIEGRTSDVAQATASTTLSVYQISATIEIRP